MLWLGDQTPEEMRDLIKKYLDENLVNIIGGCCGSTPEHIRLIAEIIVNTNPESFTVLLMETRYLKLSGLEPLVVTPESNFVNVGERTNVTGSRKFTFN